jgi:hypothetical protein
MNTAQKEEEREDMMQALVEIATIAPTFLRNVLDQVTSLTVTTACNAQLDDDLRQMATEVLISKAEAAPGMMRKHAGFQQAFIPMCFQLMLEIEEDEEWYQRSEEDEEDEDDTMYDCALQLMDRLALSIGGKTVTPIVFNLIPQFVNHAEWKYRHAGLMAISQTGEGCAKMIKTQLAQVVQLVVGKATDEHPRVRWAAVNTLGQMSSDFSPDIQKKYLAQVLPALVSVMDDKAHPRVQSHSAAASINLCEHCDKTTLNPYLSPLLGKLCELLQSPT